MFKSEAATWKWAQREKLNFDLIDTVPLSNPFGGEVDVEDGRDPGGQKRDEWDENSLSAATPTFLFIPQNAVPYQQLSLSPYRSRSRET